MRLEKVIFNMTFLKQNWFRIVIILLMLGALGQHPYSYYQFLRWATAIVSFYLAYEAYNTQRTGWIWIFAIIGILFNPIKPFYLDRETWQFCNLAVAIVFFASIPHQKVRHKDDTSSTKSKEVENEEIIHAYNLIKKAVPDYNEPNYTLAEKVFREFNDFNLKNLNEINLVYHGYIPKSLLPYPKNYIKCAYYIYLEQAKKNKDLKMFNLIQEVGTTLFYNYPDYDKYKENLKNKKWMDDVLKDISPREQFKKLYGVYEVSEEDYNSSPSSIDSTDEKLIHDFGVLPEIEKDINLTEISEKIIKSQPS